MPKVYVAIGGNVGDVKKNLARAVVTVDSLYATRVTRVSNLYETAPVGGPAGQPVFFNGAIEVETALTPRELITALHEIESSLGRVREVVDGPRTVDLDIILWDAEVVDEPDLKIPHPRMHQRGFVLVPLEELAGDVVHPILKKSVSTLLLELGDPGGVERHEGSFTPIPAAEKGKA
ncbi:MAG: 2-amino-4-hydroxy-6-hydroxymethyldihydropteridine diphosphokinase [Deltaproteobacteria bacterium]|nr:MAG: 2-amino-4-hydroxy-6-hydroxymethyldihydropteridine diphosphokinase [Deltaproteobacteria bacterium]